MNKKVTVSRSDVLRILENKPDGTSLYTRFFIQGKPVGTGRFSAGIKLASIAKAIDREFMEGSPFADSLKTYRAALANDDQTPDAREEAFRAFSVVLAETIDLEIPDMTLDQLDAIEVDPPLSTVEIDLLGKILL
jgi:hypothetical protein